LKEGVVVDVKRKLTAKQRLFAEEDNAAPDEAGHRRPEVPNADVRTVLLDALVQVGLILVQRIKRYLDAPRKFIELSFGSG